MASQAQAVRARDPLSAEPRCSLDRAIEDARRDHGIHSGAYIAADTLRELLDDLEAAA